MNKGKEFEFEVCKLVELMGFEVEITGYSQDGGVDLLAVNTSPLVSGKYVIQCKALNKPVGEPVLRDLFGTMHSHQANKGILITTSTFTAAALRFAKDKPLELIDGKKYQELCEQYGVTPFGSDPDFTIEDELLKPDSDKVQLVSANSTERNWNKDHQDFIYSVGKLTIGENLRFESPEAGWFSYPLDEILEFGVESGFNHDAPDLARLEIAFTHWEEKYSMIFVGRHELIKILSDAALAKMKKHYGSKKGCLAMMAFLLALVGTGLFAIYLMVFQN